MVGVGCTLDVESVNGKQKFVIVGVTESNPAQGFISNESPIGKAFLGHKKGDSVKVRIPKGEIEYKILDIK